MFSKLHLLILALAATTLLTASAQKVAKGLQKAAALELVYHTTDKGHLQGDPLLLHAERGWAILQRMPTATSAPDPHAPHLETYLLFDSLQVRQRATLPNGSIISSLEPLHLVGQPGTVIGTGRVQGLPCTIHRTIINSNTIDLWICRSLPFRGTPTLYSDVPDGLVLKIVRNRDHVTEAMSIVPTTENRSLPAQWGRRLEDFEFTHAIKQSRVTTVGIFDNERVCFDGSTLPPLDSLQADRVYRCGGGSIILKKVKLPRHIADRRVFAELVQHSDGDAYDRTGSVFLIPTAKGHSFLDAIRDLKSVPAFRSGTTDYHALRSTDTYDAPLELMRFITGFGVRHYNDIQVPGQQWADSVRYKMDLTPLASALSGEVWIGAYIGNWDKGGHKVSLALKYHPATTDPYTVRPLFNTVNYLEQAGQPYPAFMERDSLTVRFRLDAPARDATLLYLTTGHGGWGGGDEFNPKPNTIRLDGRHVITFVPWRDDCATYRSLNPCSGNFDNGLSSSDLSRSNWCPGTLTTPEYIPLGHLEPGEHTLTIAIPQGAPEGTSISYWCISGALLHR